VSGAEAGCEVACVGKAGADSILKFLFRFEKFTRRLGLVTGSLDLLQGDLGFVPPSRVRRCGGFDLESAMWLISFRKTKFFGFAKTAELIGGSAWVCFATFHMAVVGRPGPHGSTTR
jgi:hypothetical protein